MSSLLKIYKKASFTFVGEEDAFTLEQRILNLFSFFVFVVGIIGIFFNILYGLYESAIITAIVCLIQSLILYISRVAKKFKLAVILTGIELHLILVINYFFNGGVSGPSAILFLGILFLMSSVVKQKNAWIWLTLNLGLMAGLFYTEYYHPHFILTGYTDRVFIFLDIYTSYVLVIVLMTISILYKRKAYEKQRKNLETKAIALEKLNSEKNKLFSIISHDLRAPVGSVKQYLDFLKEHSLDDEERATIEGGLIKSTNDAYEMLDNLLVWAKSQLGGSKPFISKLKPAEILVNTLLKVKDYAQEKNITLINHIKDVEVLADENMLKIVIRNLLLNAVKFSEVDGQVIFNVYEENGHVVFMVEDNGIGISEENQEKIFSLDVKLSVGTKKEKGTGLGLVLCEEYTHLQNGKIRFQSEYGKGSTFFVSLPLAK